MSLKIESGRKIHLEILRVLAIALVLFHHTNWRGFMLFLYKDGILGFVYLFMSILCEVAVPIFFMISGALLLKKDERISDILSKRVFRFIIILFAVTVIHHVYDVLFNDKDLGSFMTVLNAFITNSASGALWYMYSYIALLLMLPFLRSIVKNATVTQYLYLITLNVLMVGILPIAPFVLSNGKYYYINTFNIVLATSMNLFFFLMGHFFENVLDENFYKLKNCIWLSVAAVAVIVVCSLLTLKWLDLGKGFADSTSSAFHYTLVAVPTFSIYAWVKYLVSRFKSPAWLNATYSHFGACTFGIYLFERILRERTVFIFDWLNVYLPCMVACGLWVIAMVLIGTAVMSVIKLIPGVKKYI